ncbi:MAG: c-type cytochrome [Oxalobacteraceae bacterium]
MNFRVSITALFALAALSCGAQAQDVEAGKKKAEACVACHGTNGNSPAGAFPTIAGQSARYIYLQLRDYKEGRRKNPMMSPIAAGLEKQDMHDLAAYFASQKQARTSFKAEPDRIKAGAAKAEESLCAMCHLGGMAGQNEVPRLAGQHPEYIVTQLKNFKARERTNDAGNMTSLAQTLSDEDITNLSHWIHSLY